MTDWIAADRNHVWHPYTQMQTAPAPNGNNIQTTFRRQRPRRAICGAVSSAHFSPKHEALTQSLDQIPPLSPPGSLENVGLRFCL